MIKHVNIDIMSEIYPVGIPVERQLENGEWEAYKSAADAHRRTGVQRTSIRKVCKGEIKEAGGYKWRYSVRAF